MVTGQRSVGSLLIFQVSDMTRMSPSRSGGDSERRDTRLCPSPFLVDLHLMPWAPLGLSDVRPLVRETREKGAASLLFCHHREATGRTRTRRAAAWLGYYAQHGTRTTSRPKAACPGWKHLPPVQHNGFIVFTTSTPQVRFCHCARMCVMTALRALQGAPPLKVKRTPIFTGDFSMPTVSAW